MSRHVVLRLFVLCVCAATLGLFVPSHAGASCVGPAIAIDGASATPAAAASVVAPGQELPVSGRYFFDGCDDVIVTTHHGPGCAPSDHHPYSQTASKDVALVLTQGARTWTLGTGDAAGEAQEWAVSWAVRLPPDVQAGPATLSAGTAQLPLEVVPR